MEHGKLERMQKDFDQAVQQHPEEVRRIQERARRAAEIYDSEEFQAFLQPAKAAILRGDETGGRAWAEDRIGIKPDRILKVRLSAKELGVATPRDTWELVDGRGAKLRSKAETETNAREAAVFDQKSKKHPRMKRALSEYRDPEIEMRRASWTPDIRRRNQESGYLGNPVEDEGQTE